MSRWFRFYDDALNDPKVQRLSGEKFKTWVNLLCLASKNGGVLPPLADVSFALRINTQKLSKLFDEFYRLQLLDEVELPDAPMSYAPHNWNARQFKSDVSNERVKRHRNAKRNVTETVTVTAPETEQNTDTETEQKRNSRTKVLDDGWPDDHGDLFWQAYPRKTEKLAAMRKLATIRKSGIVTWPDLMAGVKRYATTNLQTDPKYIKHPTSWLNAGCWADEGATTNGNRIGNPRTTGHDAILAVATRKARELDRNDPLAGPASEAGFAFGDGIDRSGSAGNSRSSEATERDRHRVEPDDQRVREGEIIPPDKDAFGVPGARIVV